jgi:type III secretory pathway component EscV
MSEDLKEVVKWLKQIPVPVSAEVEVRLREEDVDIQTMRGLCDAQMLKLNQWRHRLNQWRHR